MARSRSISPMRNRRRVEDESRNLESRSARHSDRPERSPPPRRSEQATTRRRYLDDERPFSRPSSSRRFSPSSSRGPSRRPSPSPRRSPPRSPRSRYKVSEQQSYRSRDRSPSRASKRRRTRSPSPDPPPQQRSNSRRFSRSRSRSRPRLESKDRRPPRERPFSPFRSLATRTARLNSSANTEATGSKLHSTRRRERSSPLHEHERRSPRRYSQSPEARGKERYASPVRRNPSRRFSPARRSRSPHSASRRRDPPPSSDRVEVSRSKSLHSKPSSLVDTPGQEPMDGPYPGRGGYGNPNHMTRGRGSRPYNTRGFYRGSGHSTPGSSYQGSPHSNSSYPGARGGWNGPSQYQGHPTQDTSPPFRQGSYSGSGQSQDAYFQSQSQFRDAPHQSAPFRGGRGTHRGGQFASRGQDRRYPDHNSSHRGRGAGHYNNLQWTAPGSGRESGPPVTGANSIRASPTPSYRASRESLEQPDEGTSFRSKNASNEETRDDSNQRRSDHGPSKDSKFSFAFKSKPATSTAAKPPTDLVTKTRGAHVLDNRGPPTHPKDRFQDRPNDKKNQKHNDSTERRRDYPTQPVVGRPPNDKRGRSRSPPTKRLKQEHKARPTLSPEMAASESVYYRKPGNESVVGAGTYGKVFKAIHVYTKDKVALKRIRTEGERDGFPITAVREIKILQNLRHKHVVALQEVMVEKNECFMVFEYMSHDLTGLINHPTFTLSAAHKKDLGRQMFEGLEFLHRRGVLHRDIKAANILISNTGRLKYADFGLARFYTKSRKLDYTNRVITIWYRPPELLLGETQYGPAIDVWSAACVFIEMFTKKAIFPGEGGELSQLEKVYTVLGTPTRSEWPNIVDLPWFELMQPRERRRRIFEEVFKDVLSPAALDLVKATFMYDPEKRPTAEEVLRHDYFTQEEPLPRQAHELEAVGGDWHEYESKAHRKEKDKREKERKREEQEKEKRKTEQPGSEVDTAGSKDIADSKDDALTSETKSQQAQLPSLQEPPPPPADERDLDDESDGEGSARMSMS